MIIWLASYPRSGNTMFRMMLQQCFGRKTYTKYFSPERDGDDNPAIPKLAAGGPLPESWTECYEPLARDPETYLVKTHDRPEDGAKAIYIVRNGLAAIRSYKYFLEDFNGLDYSLEQVILGETPFGSWGWHLDAWNPVQRPDTLVLKYEDLTECPKREIERVAQFTGFTQQAEWVNQFERLRARNPKLFREGPTVAPEEGFTEEQQQLFFQVHGDWMHHLDYGRPGAITQRVLRGALAERLQRGIPAGPNGSTAADERHRTLRKHWWTRLGRNIGLLPIRRPSAHV